MSEEAITQLLRDAAFAFVGTVERVGAATMEAFPADERTVVARVDRVLHAPEAFGGLTGNRVTLRLAPGGAPLQAADSSVFFANGVAFAESVALQEVGRLPLDEVEPHATMAAAEGGAKPLQSLHGQVVATRLREHADEADAVVLGRVIGLERAGGSPVREHDPDWWLATLHVVHAERGDVPQGDLLKVLYPNSLDVRWHDAPKPKAAQNGLWILHATDGDLRELAPFQLLHREDFQAPQVLESLRESAG